MAEVEGIAAERISAWFEQNIPDARPPLTFELIAGGRSNLTFRVDDNAGHTYVLRRPPTSHVLPTAHDMAREHRIISALGPTSIPVAPALGFCDDPEVNGAPFYVMGYVEGHVLRDAVTAEKHLDGPARRRAGESLVDVLAALHEIDVDAVGLGDLARREGYIERQLKRWYGQFNQSIAVTGRSVPLVDEVHDFLLANVPPQQGTAVVHGDYRLDNVLVGDDGTVRAVLDWEICTLGDPLADIGLLMVYWPEDEDEQSPLGIAATTLPGFASRAELRQRYTEQSARDLSQLDFYVAFGYWKLACILEGVYARYSGGAMGGDRSNFEIFADTVVRLAEAAKEATAQL
jgi:aminoglycoside phosphotransferase (APT) family kinase protein